jgi:hypothetical protein
MSKFSSTVKDLAGAELVIVLAGSLVHMFSARFLVEEIACSRALRNMFAAFLPWYMWRHFPLS